MADQRVATIRTVPTAPVFTRAVIDAWPIAFPEQPTVPPRKEAVGVLFAHYMLETGGLHCYGWNIGNVKYVPGRGYDYHCLRGVWEGESLANAQRLIASGEAVWDLDESHHKQCRPNVSVVYQPPHPATRFMTYLTLADSMDEHLALLAKRRYASAWPHVLSGSVRAFADALKAKGYFTSSAKAYGDGMMGHFNHFMASEDYELVLNHDVTVPVSEFSGGIIHPTLDFEPRVYDSDDVLSANPVVPWWRRLFT
jgi:hypothetical protein